ncbi:hypothetical protein L798_14406 [Zootermopsis nevadensis]|uniref:Uncharacterized protein n=1 Tax=Zootermopsis nevadensis TaxID=136037 RepID=A0A067QNW2_ZOONE|nr:hypothetical protein L798_14406 [Zootermopsis nevadensis]
MVEIPGVLPADLTTCPPYFQQSGIYTERFMYCSDDSADQRDVTKKPDKYLHSTVKFVYNGASVKRKCGFIGKLVWSQQNTIGSNAQLPADLKFLNAGTNRNWKSLTKNIVFE